MVILFDGVCNLCNGMVQFLLKHDAKDRFLFASLQSPYGIALQQHFNIEISNVSGSVLVYDNNQVYSKSKAALKIASQLGGLYKGLLLFSIFPRTFLDVVYDFVARNRYKVFGKTETCYLPGKDISYKFLDNMPFSPKA